jgi:uncharacterized protein (DUF169 family)
MINALREKFGKKCSGINLNSEIPRINMPVKQLKLCEAIHYSFDIPVKVDSENLGCPGARRSMGFDDDSGKLARLISENNGIDLSFVLEALNNIPALKGFVNSINLGITEELESLYNPDLYIIYIHPSRITEIMHRLAKYSIKVNIPNLSLLSVCGNVFANTYLTRQVSISFGCPESRKFGGVAPDEVVMGIPESIAGVLVA